MPAYGPKRTRSSAIGAAAFGVKRTSGYLTKNETRYRQKTRTGFEMISDGFRSDTATSQKPGYGLAREPVSVFDGIATGTPLSYQVGTHISETDFKER